MGTEQAVTGPGLGVRVELPPSILQAHPHPWERQHVWLRFEGFKCRDFLFYFFSFFFFFLFLTPLFFFFITI